MKSKIIIGKFGEKIAERYLQNNGYQIIAKNYYTRAGEIDLICEKNNVLIFVEIKTRTTTAFGWPEEAITVEKQKHLVKAAEKFLENYDKDFYSVQIDAISINLVGGKTARIKH